MKNIIVEYLNDSSYFALLTTLNSNSPVDLIKEYEHENEFICSGKIIVDTILYSGNNDDRFIEISCKDGRIDFCTLNHVQIERKNNLRVTANNILRKYPNIINNSILNNAQKQLLLHGISI
ncbi:MULTISPECIES: type II toxin-antitoxin system RnlB family antitoxin [Bacillus]|uniref:Uncharacterized protein n=1 Tax=Bacillus cereus TaxID=1396 RepID=A0A150AXE3_BACCE|nr:MULTISPECIES: type II toxin-antitoxin system RnlB family antitoxin [Bacillus]KXX88334.1 hypothetical protein AT274_09625 [Bacillus cereus]MCG3790973.1 type II toxin-antitoxin system RnlB family antitoxin [Bacillus sp. UTDS19-33BHI26]RSC62949.1 hypothetical protein EGS86_13750 [Bacillus sp. (in: firmicutes)]HDX9541510.1 type II toxin-antitoxin system RnlB family antitoxin [Bacillus thuringiensis]